MRTRRVIIPAILACLVFLVANLAKPNRNGPFAKYICSPVPPSVRVVIFQNRDFLSIDPEPVCHLSFTASPQDMADIVRKGRFQSFTDWVPGGPGPAGWRSADQLGPTGRVYSRAHSPRNPNSRLYVGSNRRWSEYLWVDETGTNAYFLLWGI